jgi:hypothetical protein
MGKINIATVTYNSSDNLEIFIPSLIENKEFINKIIFIDNASKDDTLKKLESLKESLRQIFEIKIISNKKNIGYSAGINIGIKESILSENIKYTLVTNNDCIFKKDFLKTLIEESVKFDSLATGTKSSINFPQGGTILFRNDFFNKIGFYDEELFFGGDELDFSFRVYDYNLKNTEKIKIMMTKKIDNLLDHKSKHNRKNLLRKAYRMLRGNAHVYLKNRYTPLSYKLYKEQ